MGRQGVGEIRGRIGHGRDQLAWTDNHDDWRGIVIDLLTSKPTKPDQSVRIYNLKTLVLFSGQPCSADAAAAIYYLIETVSVHGLKRVFADHRFPDEFHLPTGQFATLGSPFRFTVNSRVVFFTIGLRP